MWIVRWILVAIVIVLFLGFSLENSERVQVDLGFQTIQEVPLFIALYFAFAIGLVVWFIVSTFQIMQVKSDLKSCRRENRALQEELTALRNLPLEETLGESESEEQV